MPMLWDRSKREKRTPFSDLLSDYLEAHWPMLPKHLAVQTGLSATAIQRYLNKGVVPHDPRILEKIHAGTGIPLADLYRAVGMWVAAALPVEAMVPPPAPRPLPVQQQPAPLSAFDEAVRRIQATEHPAVAEVLIRALYATAGRTDPRDFWKTKIEEWQHKEHDTETIDTLQLPAILPASAVEAHDADPSQEESRPAGSRT